ncbi:hypothetical protein BDZ89DRAFT_1145151 [Hymenopellis radicata]|nr:hypothetical protein BDZ89DRAFT_1145151 [Hymenopellis radicata]
MVDRPPSPSTLLLQQLTAYERPPPTRSYSQEQFSSITFSEVNGISLPATLPRGALLGHCFSTQVPVALASVAIVAEDTLIPHEDDLRGILPLMRDAFAKGMRSVIVDVRLNATSDETHRFLWHFQKVRLFMNIHKNRLAVSWAVNLVNRVRTISTTPGIFPVAAVLPSFMDTHILAPICGLFSTDFPMWKLGYLLAETWVEEDVMNGLAEVTYFRLAATQSRILHLYLPTTFLLNTLESFPTQQLSPPLRALRQRLHSTHLPVQIGFLRWKEDHYTAITVKDNALHIPETITAGAIARQGVGGGFGSCAIAAHNFVEHSFDATVERWRGSSSTHHRDQLISDLLLYNYSASISAGNFESWTQRCIPEILDTQSSRDEFEFRSYNDFNLYEPLDSHPIHKYIVYKARNEQLNAHSQLERPVQRRRNPLAVASLLCTPGKNKQVPLVDELRGPSVPLIPGVNTPSLLQPAFEMKPPLDKSYSTPTRFRSPRSRPLHSHLAVDADGDVIDISSSSPSPIRGTSFQRSPSIVEISPPSISRNYMKRSPPSPKSPRNRRKRTRKQSKLTTSPPLFKRSPSVEIILQATNTGIKAEDSADPKPGFHQRQSSLAIRRGWGIRGARRK